VGKRELGRFRVKGKETSKIPFESMVCPDNFRASYVQSDTLDSANNLMLYLNHLNLANDGK